MFLLKDSDLEIVFAHKFDLKIKDNACNWRTLFGNDIPGCPNAKNDISTGSGEGGIFDVLLMMLSTKKDSKVCYEHEISYKWDFVLFLCLTLN